MECWHKSKVGSDNPNWRDKPSKIRVCVYCGQIFNPLYDKNKKYCSSECYLTYKRSVAQKKDRIPIAEMKGKKHPRWAGDKLCKICGKELLGRVERRRGTCSGKCKAKAIKQGGRKRSAATIRKAILEGGKTTFICSQCGKEVYRQPSEVRIRKYCSDKCRQLASRKKVDYCCECCGKVFGVYPSRIKSAKEKGYTIRFCSNRCRLNFYAPSGLERTVAHLLDDMRIAYEIQYRPRKQRCFYDFYLSSLNLLIEVDGAFYHHSAWAKTHGIPQRDKAKDKLANAFGIRLLRLDEDQIKNTLPEIRNQIMALWAYQKMLDWA